MMLYLPFYYSNNIHNDNSNNCKDLSLTGVFISFITANVYLTFLVVSYFTDKMLIKSHSNILRTIVIISPIIYYYISKQVKPGSISCDKEQDDIDYDSAKMVELRKKNIESS